MSAIAPYKPSHGVSTMEFATNDTSKRHQPYDALHNVIDGSDSSTEVGDEWDTENAAQPRRRRKTVWRRVRRYRWMIDTTLLLVIVGLLAEKRWQKYEKGHLYELAGDITGFAPTFGQQIVSFKPNTVFAPEEPTDFWSKETQHAWLSIVPEGLGYVEVKNASEYSNLPHPIHDYPNQTVFTTSVTHQLHCLYTILEAYNTMKLTVASPASVDPIKKPWHINHCFEYIRQAIMCAGDVALEGAATSFPGGEHGQDLGGSDGWDAKHVCKDYGQVYEYLERETINHMKWISSG
ncbi:hypothetical protein GGP41_009746 [Bipolaris sorokiniana]|uniref:DUF3328 domain-containing protein n=1 Tax=Cochliobolus sativus TaxID=45130 RepID=A0A8H5ZE73_COCSA|nr:hypothetical protein GGP41_009746 [Bipolaris sorokiniana]